MIAARRRAEMTRRHGQRDDQSERIKDRLLDRKGHVRHTAKDYRWFVEPVLHLYTTKTGQMPKAGGRAFSYF
jgi:hypothetical protein